MTKEGCASGQVLALSFPPIRPRDAYEGVPRKQCWTGGWDEQAYARLNVGGAGGLTMGHEGAIGHTGRYGTRTSSSNAAGCVVISATAATTRMACFSVCPAPLTVNVVDPSPATGMSVTNVSSHISINLRM